jgi:hypothetical protein
VPTGMKAGVRTGPCGVIISPQRAAPSVAINRKENAIAAGYHELRKRGTKLIG